jgi:hypothetical protein
MAKILQFPTLPNHTYATEICAGCDGPVSTDSWELDLPSGGSSIHHIALCEHCYKDAQRHGIFA